MRATLLALAALFPLVALADSPQDTPIVQPGEIRQDVYGPGIHQDAYGRPVEYRTKPSSERVQGPVKPDVYGPGVGQDQYGRPVKVYPKQ